MSNTQQNWLSAQSSRRYPLDDNATGTGDDGTRLNDDIIVDMHLKWPVTYGAFAFIGGITVTANIVTVVILAADSPTAVSGFYPLAAITIRQPATEYSFYALEPLCPGVGGFIAFGDLKEAFSIRFATPQQGLLSPKVARAYEELPIPSMRKYGRTDGLVDVVKLLGGPDIEVLSQTRTIDDVDVDAIVIRLQSPTSIRNPLADFIGPCGIRPESNNCDRVGVQTLNGVQPDCNGNLTIDFQSLITANYTDCGSEAAGVTLEQIFGISDVCPIRAATRFIGNDSCHGGSSLSIPVDGWPIGGGGGNGGGEDTSSESVGSYACADLPFQDCFDGMLDPSWRVRIGLAQRIAAAPSPEYPCPAGSECVTVAVSGTELFGDVLDDVVGMPIYGDVFTIDNGSSESCVTLVSEALQLYDRSRRNVMIWADCGTGSSLGKKVTTHVQLVNIGSTHNAGIVMNYHTVDRYTNPRINYFLAQINRNANRVELLRYNGTNLVLENSVTPAIPFAFLDWFEIITTVTSEIGGTLIDVEVRNVTSPSWPVVSFQLLTNRWGDADGFFGVHATQSVANFSFWRLEDA